MELEQRVSQSLEAAGGASQQQASSARSGVSFNDYLSSSGALVPP